MGNATENEESGSEQPQSTGVRTTAGAQASHGKTPRQAEDDAPFGAGARHAVEAGADEERRLPEPNHAEQADGPVIEAPAEEATEPTVVDLGLLEALLFATRHPLTAGRLGELLGLASTTPVRRAVKQLNERYAETSRAFRVEQVAGGFQLLTLPEYGETLKKLHQKEADAKLTKAALETLAVVAYKQPILRAEIEAIRGVACGETVRSLMEKHLVRIAGRAEEPGRPILYGTTRRFLEIFGLASIKDLPKSEDQPLKPAAKI